MENNCSGTLALDLGNTNTVLAFQNENDSNFILIEIPGITSSPGVVPSVVWFEGEDNVARIGLSALKKKNLSYSEKYFHSNFKRLFSIKIFSNISLLIKNSFSSFSAVNNEIRYLLSDSISGPLSLHFNFSAIERFLSS